MSKIILFKHYCPDTQMHTHTSDQISIWTTKALIGKYYRHTDEHIMPIILKWIYMAHFTPQRHSKYVPISLVSRAKVVLRTPHHQSTTAENLIIIQQISSDNAQCSQLYVS